MTLVAQMREEQPDQAIKNAEQAYQMLVNNQLVLEEKEEEFEEYDGLNHEEARGFLLLVDLPVLTRAHSLDIRVSPQFVRVYLYQIYKLELGLPLDIEAAEAKSFFDCKLRKLFLYLPKKAEKAETHQEKTKGEEESKVETREEKEEEEEVAVSTQPLQSNEMLFDIV